MPLPPKDKADHAQSLKATSFFAREGKAFLAYLSKIAAAITLVATAFFAFDGDSPDRLRSDIPKGVSAGKTVFSNTRWFRCSVAIFELEPKFLADLRTGGIAFLNAKTEAPWQVAPMVFDTSRKWPFEFTNSLDCIAEKDLQTLFNTVSENGGYYQVQNSNSVMLIAPDAGLMMVGGYD